MCIRDSLIADEKNELLKYKNNLSNAIGKNDKDIILAAIDALNNYSGPIAHRMMDINISAALKGTKSIE